MLTRRSAFKAAAGVAAASAFGTEAMAQGADKVIKVGLNLSYTGADALGAQRIANGGTQQHARQTIRTLERATPRRRSRARHIFLKISTGRHCVIEPDTSHRSI